MLCEPFLQLYEQLSKKQTGNTLPNTHTHTHKECIYKISGIYRAFYKNKFRFRTNLL